MPTVVSTPGSPTANSYITVVEADIYHSERLFSTAWTGSLAAVKEAAVIMSTRLIDGYLCFTGTAATTTQALVWPRSGMLARNGGVVGTSTIPTELKNATAELARLLIIADRTADNEANASGIKRVKAGPVDITFRDDIPANTVPLGVQTLLVPAWLCASTVITRLFEVL